MYSDWLAEYMRREIRKVKKNLRTAPIVNPMNKLIDALKQTNRIILEMYLGILAWGLVCQLVGVFFAKNPSMYSGSLWFGIVFSMVNTLQMYRALDRALDFDEQSARKIVSRSFAIRYIALILFLGVIMITGIMDGLVVFLGYMSMKVAAYLQPITHKLCNKLFHETDPIPEAMPEDDEELDEWDMDPDEEEHKFKIRR